PKSILPGRQRKRALRICYIAFRPRQELSRSSIFCRLAQTLALFYLLIFFPQFIFDPGNFMDASCFHLIPLQFPSFANFF
uniref:Uncharacterized protein n=1 Tax=Aegilops tauschii subsp. strangulata TaxID=200361 RepID=A0A453MV80_AEGTS